MAEVAVLLGVAAAATQFTDIGCRILLHASTLYSRFRSVPQCLQRALDQVQLLLQLADLFCKNDALQLVSEKTSASTQPLSTNGLSSLSWLNNVWKNCTAQAQGLEKMIKSMLCETENSHGRRIWKKILTVKREENILQIMTEIERYKSMLNIWLGQNCLENIYQMRQNVLENQGTQLTYLAKQITAMRADMKTHLKSRTYLAHDARTTQVKHLCQEQYAELPQGSLTSTVPVMPDKTKLSFNSATFYCKCRSMNRRSIIPVGDGKLQFRHCKVMHEDCPVHQRSSNTSQTDLQYRKGVNLLSAMVELSILLKWTSGFPSLGFSLRTEARVEVLPLYRFFRGLLYHHLDPVKTPLGITWKERQNYMFCVAKKTLLQAYQSGNASPQDVDETGRTLLHLLIELSDRRHEVFLAQMIHLLLSIGFRGDTVDDKFCTAQQALVQKLRPYRWEENPTVYAFETPIKHTLLEWTPCALSKFTCVIGIMDCILRWPESASDWGYPQISDIVTRRSIRDLQLYISNNVHLKERTDRQINPLHFTAAACWPQGTELLLAHGVDKYAPDICSHYPLEIAIMCQCIPVVQMLLQGDCVPYFSQRRSYQSSTLPPCFLRRGLSGNHELQVTVVKALARHRSRLGMIRPYHDLAENPKDSKAIAEKLFAAGFHKIEEYNDEGMSPLMYACCWGNASMISFLLEHGADSSRPHRHAPLRAGHFFFPAVESWPAWSHGHVHGDELGPQEEATLLQTAFDNAIYVGSRCQCSPEGFSPAASTFQANRLDYFFIRRWNSERLLRHLGMSEVQLRQQWRGFVRMEIFNRLEITHTCIRQFPKVRTFPEEDRLEIEEEEEELHCKLARLMTEYDNYEEQFEGDILSCVDSFFDELDQHLRPEASFLSWPADGFNHDILGRGTTRDDPWMTSRGNVILKHKESTHESYLLQYLFDQPD